MGKIFKLMHYPILVDVDDSEETVHVSVPIRLVPEVMAQLQDQDKRAL